MMRIISAIFILGWSVLLLAQTRTFRLPDLERTETQVFPVGVSPTPLDPLLMALGNPQTRDGAIRQYKLQGGAAAPGLVKHLQNPNTGIRLLAMSALQYAWMPGCENAVLPFLKSTSDAEAKSAWFLLKQKMDQDQLDKWVMDNFYGLNSDRLEEVLGNLESKNPDPARMLELLSRPGCWRAALPYLPRYTSPAFQNFTRYIAGQAHGEWLALTVASQIQQGDRDPLVYRQMESLLANEDARVREMVAEYYRWHGGKSSIPLLNRAVEDETDLFARASLQEAVRIIGLREEVEFPPPRQPMEPAVKYAEGLRGETAVVAGKRIAALRKAMGYSGQEVRKVEGDAAWILVPPVRSFFTDNDSWGLYVREGGGPFSGSVHLARDVSWGEDMATVLAIAPGVVKRVQIARESWGGLVVIEHTAPHGKKFCSLYGHLGPLVTVHIGDEIKAGTKLGGLGRSFTAENGGYKSHLHFSVYDAPYGFGSWVNGYMKPEEFERGDHKWIDPYVLYQVPKK